MKPVSVYVKFKESIFQDHNTKYHIFNMSEWDYTVDVEGVIFTEKVDGKTKVESLLIPWNNIIVMRTVYITEKTS